MIKQNDGVYTAHSSALLTPRKESSDDDTPTFFCHDRVLNHQGIERQDLVDHGGYLRLTRIADWRRLPN